VDLLWAAKDLTESGANSHQYETTARAMCDATGTGGDPRAEGRARTTLTNVLLVSGRIQQAAEQAELAMTLAQSARDTTAVSWVANDRGLISLHQGRYADGQAFLEQAIAGYRAADNRAGEALSLCNLSRAHLGMGNTAKAVAIAHSGLTAQLDIGRTMRLANGHFTLGIALTGAGRHTDALGQFSDALRIFEDHRQRLWQGTTNFRIAQVHLAAHRPAQAAQHAEQALALGCIGGDRMRGNVLTLLGRALAGIGQADRAGACWRDALTLFQQCGAPEADEVRALLSPATAA
jgi:tetratricopeptide (TPR) repeat protein